jgi:hypothetical protein
MQAFESVTRSILSGGLCEDVVHTLMLAHLNDAQSAFHRSRFSRDALSNVLRYFIPSSPGNGKPFLVPRPLSRSYYQICFERCEPVQLYRQSFRLSKDRYAAFNSVSFNPDSMLNYARRVIAFLFDVRRECDETRRFADYSAEEMDALFDEYVLFLLLLKSLASKNYGHSFQAPLFPPSRAVQAVWFSHMLQSAPYGEFITHLMREEEFQLYSSEFGDYVGTTYHHLCLYSDADRAALERKSQQLWQEAYPEAQATATKATEQFKALKAKLLLHFTPAMFVADQDWLVEFVRFTRGTDVFSNKFLMQAHLGMPEFSFVLFLFFLFPVFLFYLLFFFFFFFFSFFFFSFFSFFFFFFFFSFFFFFFFFFFFTFQFFLFIGFLFLLLTCKSVSRRKSIL